MALAPGEDLSLYSFLAYYFGNIHKWTFGGRGTNLGENTVTNLGEKAKIVERESTACAARSATSRAAASSSSAACSAAWFRV
jgi:hypothetical protein